MRPSPQNAPDSCGDSDRRRHDQFVWVPVVLMLTACGNEVPAAPLTAGEGSDFGRPIGAPSPEFVGVVELPPDARRFDRAELGQRLDGEFDFVRVEGAPYRVTVDTAPDWTMLGLYNDADDGSVAMGAVIIEGDVQSPELSIGEVLSFNTLWPSETITQIGVLGCAGPEEGVWVSDTMANEVVVRVVPGNEGRRALEFEAQFGSFGDLQGTVLLPPEDELM